MTAPESTRAGNHKLAGTLPHDQAAGADPAAGPAELHGDFFRLSETMFGGWVIDLSQPERRICVEIWYEGTSMQVVRADCFVPELCGEFGTDGCHGFLCDIGQAAIDEAGLVTAYVANTDIAIGNVVAPDNGGDAPERVDIPGSVRWIGGLRLIGWACDRMNLDRRLRVFAYCGNELVGEARADRMYEPERGEAIPTGPFGFEMMLPLAMASGKMHEIRVIDERGTELSGSPLAVATLSDDLSRLTGSLTQAADFEPRADFLQTIFPGSLPFDSYDAWKRAYPLPPLSRHVSRRFGILVIGEADAIADTVASIEASTTDDWFIAAIDGSRPFSAADWQSIEAEIVRETAQSVVILHAGDRLHPEALERLADAESGAATENGNASVIYTDCEMLRRDGTLLPVFKPAFDLERARTQGYLHGLVAFDADLIPALPAAENFSLPVIVAGAVAAAIRQARPIVHLPQILVTTTEREPSDESAIADAAAAAALLTDESITQGATADDDQTRIEWGYGAVYPALRLRPAIAHDTHVTIIIPTRDREELLRACLSTLRERTDWPHYDIIVVDNDSRDADTLAYLAELEEDGVTILRQPGPFNFSRLNNAAARIAQGSHLLLLNNDTECAESGWLTAMLEAAHAPDAGAIGARLLWPSGIVQHGGVVLGPYFGAVHAFNDCLAEDTAYDDLMCTTREVSAVTGACLLVRREDYWSVGGLDERLFPVNFNDVDFCLKLRAAGKRNIWTPHATLLHKESASRKRDLTTERRGRATRELRALRLKWRHALLDDPCYSPSLNRDAYPYSALAWPPRKRLARSKAGLAERGAFIG
ncbi:GT2 family glycosyltransferase [Pseudochelatococcus lubricantis]|uniref:GT2 family glycosyltransferase n=1 Tax=Pseudochelatococcus lubricantis TaxID=1538102 RepID=A0ABX0V2Y4_9HYPH|nr:glycosyltransferase family 2 protein [Pseudochelatococcus lubricantis]NIJ58730.1 GT2 family glycosyltransferase [Pseudochelatococcus lubricantis]